MTLCRSDTRRKERRTNGLQMPWHPQQVAGWLVLAAFGSCSFGILLPGLGPDLYPVTLFVLGSLFFLHVVSHVAALLIDPADPQLRAALQSPSRHGGGGDHKSTAVPEFDKSKHAHVIENGKCHLCNIYTSGHRTKHCGSCNKCVEKFDHHCKWLNHCIGARNYVAFIVSVVSAVLACLVIVLVSSAELLLYNADPADVEHYLGPIFGTNETALQVHQLFSVSRLPVEQNMFVTIAFTQCALALIAMVLLLHLCAFHVYISALGITTYEYIRNYRRYPEFDSRNGASSMSTAADDHPSVRPGSRNNESSLMTKLYASACCYAASSGRSKRPSCGIHSDLNDRAQQQNGGSSMATVETIESYGRVPAVAAPNDDSLETAAAEQRPPKCRYCLEKNSRIRSGGGAFFVLGKRRKGFCCCCFQKPEPMFGGAAGAAESAMLHHRRIMVPPSPFAVRRNRVIPTDRGDRLSAVVDEWKSFNSGALPALPQPFGRRSAAQQITLKELGQVLAFVEQQPSARNLRRKSGAAGAVNGAQIKHSKSSSNLSPIHESGLSNPSTPQLKNRYPQTRPCSWLSPPPHNASQSA